MFCYVNSVFAPGLDEGVGNLWRVSLPAPYVYRYLSDDSFAVFQDGRGIGGELQCYAGVWMKEGEFVADNGEVCYCLT